MIMDMNFFTTGRLEAHLHQSRERAADAVESASVKDWLESPVEDVVASLLTKYKVASLVIGSLDDVEILDEQPVEVWAPQRDNFGNSVNVPQVALHFHVPVDGDIDLLRMDQPAMIGGDSPLFHCEFKVGHVVVTVQADTLTPPIIRAKLESSLQQLNVMADRNNAKIAESNRKLAERVRAIVERRTQRAHEGRALMEGLDIPVRRKPDAERVEVAPVKRKQLRPTLTEPDREPRLADDIYQDIVRTIEGMSKAMERTPTAAKLHEEEIRNLILFILNANYEGQARGEVFNGAGKTDLLLTWRDRNVFIGECKFWTGQKGFTDAINQLLSYLVWRDTKAALIMFIRDQEVSPVMKKAYDAAQEHPNFIEDETSAAADPEATTRRYVFHSPRDTHQKIHLALIFVILPAAA